MTRAIKYAQCWEDPAVLRQALAVGTSDDVVSVASAGDNTLALLLDKPRSVTAVDMNPAQLYLLELKMRAIQTLEYEDFIRFVGVRPSRRRLDLYRQLRGCLADSCAYFWDRNSLAVERGIIHQGKLERYLRAFRTLVLPFIHSDNTVRCLLASSSIERQREIYQKQWNSLRWRLLFRLSFSRAALGAFARDRSHFRHVQQHGIAQELMARTRRGMMELPIQDNYFLHYMLTGQYRDLEAAPPYLRPANFPTLRERIPRLRLHCSELTRFLRSCPAEAYSRFNLSDILEYMSPTEVGCLLTELLRVSRCESKAAFWTLFVSHDVPRDRRHRISEDRSLQHRLRSLDRGFFYSGFRLWNLRTISEKKRLADADGMADRRKAHV